MTSPLQGDVVSTVWTVECEGFSDPHLPLTYTAYSVDSDGQGQNESARVTSRMQLPFVNLRMKIFITLSVRLFHIRISAFCGE